MNPIIFIDGDQLEPKQAEVFDFQKLFLQGEGVFETLRTYRGKVFQAEAHLRRLATSLWVIGAEKPRFFDRCDFLLNQALEEFRRVHPGKEAKLRVIILSGQIIVTAEPLPEKPTRYYEEGVDMAVYSGQRVHPQAKCLGSAVCLESKRFASQSGAYESILVHPDGRALEGSYSNLFWVRDGELVTNSDDILHGITRETVIGISGQCRFESVLLEDLKGVDECFLTQTTSGILPVRSIDGQVIGGGSAGPLTRKLIHRFNEITRYS